MRRFPILLTLLAVAPTGPFGSLVAQRAPQPGRYTLPRSQVALDAALHLALAASYAYRIRETPVFIGARVGVAWELNEHTFEREVWEVIHFEGFARLQPTEWFQGELGLSVAGSSPADDTNERRMFYGGYVGAMVGYRFFFIGPQLRLGTIESETGVIYSTAFRVVFPLRVG